MVNHYFDDTHPLRPYTHSTYATPGTAAPVNALRKELPQKLDGFYFGEKNGDWTYIEDHRGKEGYVDGTPYTISDFGPLPDGWSDAPPPPPEPTIEERTEQFRAAIQSHLDAFAQTRNYDGIMSAASYATSAVEKFRVEGQYAVDVRDATWAKAYELLAEWMEGILSGERGFPTDEEIFNELPALEWPIS